MAHGRRVAPTGRLEPLGSREGETENPRERERERERKKEKPEPRTRTLSCKTNNFYSIAISRELFVIKFVSVICEIGYKKLILKKIERKKWSLKREHFS